MLVKRFFPPPGADASPAASSASPRRTFPPFKPNERASTRPRPSTSATTRRCWPTARRCPGLRTPATSTSSSSLPSSSPARSPTPTPGRGPRGDRGLVRAQRLERPRRAGGGGSPRRLRAGGQVEDLRQLDRLPTCSRADELPDWTVASPGGCGSTARSGARAPPPGPPTTSARCSPTPQPASASSAGDIDLDRDDAGLLRARARPLDRARADGRAGDRRDRNPDQQDRRATMRTPARRRLGPGPARPQRLRDPRRGRPRLRAVHRPPRRLRPLERLLPADARRRRPRRRERAPPLRLQRRDRGRRRRRALQGLALVAARAACRCSTKPRG